MSDRLATAISRAVRDVKGLWRKGVLTGPTTVQVGNGQAITVDDWVSHPGVGGRALLLGQEGSVVGLGLTAGAPVMGGWGGTPSVPTINSTTWQKVCSLDVQVPADASTYWLTAWSNQLLYSTDDAVGERYACEMRLNTDVSYWSSRSLDRTCGTHWSVSVQGGRTVNGDQLLNIGTFVHRYSGSGSATPNSNQVYNNIGWLLIPLGG